jgi:hypothetical protein
LDNNCIAECTWSISPCRGKRTDVIWWQWFVAKCCLESSDKTHILGHLVRFSKWNAYKNLFWKSEGKRPLGRHRRRQEDNIKMYFSVYSRCYATIVRWGLYQTRFWATARQSYCLRNGYACNGGIVKKRIGSTSSVDLCKGGWEEMAL